MTAMNVSAIGEDVSTEYVPRHACRRTVVPRISGSDYQGRHRRYLSLNDATNAAIDRILTEAGVK